MVWLPLASANRDPAEFPDADQVIIDREGTGTSPSAPARTAAWARTSPARSC